MEIFFSFELSLSPAPPVPGSLIPEDPKVLPLVPFPGNLVYQNALSNNLVNTSPWVSSNVRPNQILLLPHHLSLLHFLWFSADWFPVSVNGITSQLPGWRSPRHPCLTTEIHPLPITSRLIIHSLLFPQAFSLTTILQHTIFIIFLKGKVLKNDISPL